MVVFKSITLISLWVSWYTYHPPLYWSYSWILKVILVYCHWAEGIGKSYQHAPPKRPRQNRRDGQRISFWEKRDNLAVLFQTPFRYWVSSMIFSELKGTCELVIRKYTFQSVTNIFEYSNIFVTNIYSDIHSNQFFFYEYIQTFVRVKFVCTNIFGHSLVRVLECKT